MPTASRVVARSACPRPNAETGGSLRARTASYTQANGRFVIPARTAVVFVVPENLR